MLTSLGRRGGQEGGRGREGDWQGLTQLHNELEDFDADFSRAAGGREGERATRRGDWQGLTQLDNELLDSWKQPWTYLYWQCYVGHPPLIGVWGSLIQTYFREVMSSSPSRIFRELITPTFSRKLKAFYVSKNLCAKSFCGSLNSLGKRLGMMTHRSSKHLAPLASTKSTHDSYRTCLGYADKPYPTSTTNH